MSFCTFTKFLFKLKMIAQIYSDGNYQLCYLKILCKKNSFLNFNENCWLLDNESSRKR